MGPDSLTRRVLHAIRSNGYSGAERHLVSLIADLRAEGWQSDVVLATAAPESVAPFAQGITEAGGSVRVIPAPRDASPRLLAAMVRARRSGRYDVIHSHLVHADWHAGLAALLTRGPPLVSTKHNHDPFRTTRAFRAVEGRFIRTARATIAISASLADFVEQWYGVRPTVVLYGLAAGEEPREPPRGSGSPTRLLAVGRLEPQKGFDVLVDAVARAAATGADVELRVAGEGGQRPALERKVEELGQSGRVELLGQRDDVEELMRHADVLVHPARWEGFGLVLLEAMRAGLPIIASNVGAIPEVVEAGRTALLVPPDDPDALGEAIARLAHDPGLRSELGRDGRRRLQQSFSPRQTARLTAEVYRSVVPEER